MNKPIDWRDHFIRFFFITLGVFIGFGLNTCNETRKEKDQVKLYIEGLREELNENKAELEKSLPYHQGLLKKLEAKPAEANLILDPAEVSSVNWELADNEVFKKHLSHELYKKLSTVYQIHYGLIDQHKEGSRLMSEMNVLGPVYALSIIDKDLTDEEQAQVDAVIQMGWIPIFQTWVSIEELYLEKIGEVLEIMNK